MNALVIGLCTKWGIHSRNLPWRIAFLHGCAQSGRWNWIKTYANAICGNCSPAETWDWCGQHIAQHLWCWMRLMCWNACAMKHETRASTRRVWFCAANGKWSGMAESNVCSFCDIWLQVVHLTSFVHGQNGWTPLLWATINSHVEIAQLLVEKGANIQATDTVQYVAFVL